jgi:phage repressor protein C with HTH and peptisase S24 domain
MDISTRLDEAMRAAGIQSQSALSRASGVPQPTINRILKGVGKKGPESHTLVQLAKACNVSFEWLHEGVGSMARENTAEPIPAYPVRKVTIPADDESEFVRVPLIELKLHAGVPGFQADPEYNDSAMLSLPRQWIEQKHLNPSSLVAMKVKGDSMYPSLKEGNTVIINTDDTYVRDGELYAVNYDGKALVKRLEREGGVWYLASDNPLPEFRRRAVQDMETVIVGRVVRMERDFI